MIKPITALVFIKEKSERVPGKNFLLFGGIPLYRVIIDTLRTCKFISKVLINTDSSEVMDFYGNDEFVCIQPRSKQLKKVTRNEANLIIQEMISNSSEKVFFNTHTTNPLLTSSTIDIFISNFFKSKFDSMFMATKLKTRCWSSDLEPINFKRNEIVKTQDLDPIYIDNSCGYIFKNEIFLKEKNRVSGKIGLMEISELESLDIDTKNQFELASMIFKTNHRQ